MSKRVLFPTDGSAAALSAAERVANQLSGFSELQVTVLVAVAYYDATEADCGEDFIQQRNAYMRRRADTAVTQTASVFEKHGIKTTTRILEGDPVSAVIAREAVDGKYDLIAMGSRGLSLEKDRSHYLGGVAQHVLRRVAIPVLVIPITSGDATDEEE